MLDRYHTYKSYPGCAIQASRWMTLDDPSKGQWGKQARKHFHGKWFIWDCKNVEAQLVKIDISLGLIEKKKPQ